MDIYVAWRTENVDELEDYLEEYRSDLNDNSLHDMEFEDRNEKVTIDGSTVCYTGPGGRLHGLLEDRDDLEVRIEEEKVIEYPYGVTD